MSLPTDVAELYPNLVHERNRRSVSLSSSQKNKSGAVAHKTGRKQSLKGQRSIPSLKPRPLSPVARKMLNQISSSKVALKDAKVDEDEAIIGVGQEDVTTARSQVDGKLDPLDLQLKQRPSTCGDEDRGGGKRRHVARKSILRGDLDVSVQQQLTRRQKMESESTDFNPPSPVLRAMSSTVYSGLQPRSRHRRRILNSSVSLDRLNFIPNISASQKDRPLEAEKSMPATMSVATLPLFLDDREDKNDPLGSGQVPGAWGEDEGEQGVFLTEVDAQIEANRHEIARLIARGSYKLYGCGNSGEAASMFARATEVCEQGVSLQKEMETTGMLSSFLYHHWGMALKENGRVDEARDAQMKSLELARSSHLRRLEGRALKALGVLYMDEGRYERSFAVQQEALVIALESGDAELESRVYANLGNLAAVQSKFGRALAYHARDLRLSQASRVHSALGQARAHENLSKLYAKLGKSMLKSQHEQCARKLCGCKAFVMDLERHPDDCVGNIYYQVDDPDDNFAKLIKSSFATIVQEYHAAKRSVKKPLAHGKLAMTSGYSRSPPRGGMIFIPRASSWQVQGVSMNNR